METNWVGSKEEQDFFDEYLKVADRLEYAKSIVRQRQRHLPEYWLQMCILCEHKARLLNKERSA